MTWVVQLPEGSRPGKHEILVPEGEVDLFSVTINSLHFKLDQGALGMSDPWRTLPLALKPNAVPRINCLLSNFYFCANWSVVPCQMIGLEGPVWGGGYMPRRRRLYATIASWTDTLRTQT